MKTVFIPKLLAKAQACWPPAPPKQANTCDPASYPFASVMDLHIHKLI